MAFYQFQKIASVNLKPSLMRPVISFCLYIKLLLSVVAIIIFAPVANRVHADKPDVQTNKVIFSTLDPDQPYKGVAFLASKIGADIKTNEILAFVRTRKMNLVIIDFAWITYHWERSRFKSINDLIRNLKKEGVEIAFMYRPRVLKPSEADVHFAKNPDGKIATHHNNLCFAYEDSLEWAAKWGVKILKEFPSVNKIILYNLNQPCFCEHCQDRQHMAKLLSHCRNEWQKIQPRIQIGHVGLASEYAEEVDFLCPFLSVNREGNSAVDIAALVAQIKTLKASIANKAVIPLAKICWESSTNNTTEDIINTIKICSAENTGYILWYYSWIFHSTDNKYNTNCLVASLVDASKRLPEYSQKAPASKTQKVTPQMQIFETVPKLTFPYKEKHFDKLPWPYQRPGLKPKEIAQLNREVWVINDFPLYQSDEEGGWCYIHGGLDIVLDNGTKIYAMKKGWVKAIHWSS
ncbi:MAG: hypothetical protein JXA52_01480, partial [Planctomycetes bacterium]|nr:hypothetical protein [Planctomycetota bacterium]